MNETKDKKPHNLDVRLKIKNFALIEDADIDIKDFTVFVGPNNSGKSYLAMLLYALNQAIFTTDPPKIVFEKNFGTRVDNLVREDQKKASITYSLGETFRVEIEITHDGEFDFKVTNNGDVEPGMNKTFYLPASRSGFLISQKPLLYTLLESTKFSSSPDASSRIPMLPGPVADFLQDISYFDEEEDAHQGLFDEDLNLFEKHIFKGRVEIQYDKKHRQGSPEFHYVAEGTKARVPIARASSGVTEMIPFYIYLKYKVKPGDILIMEEPESHLHPEIQFELIRLTTRLIRKGVRIIFTTHSDFILSSINVFLKAGLNKPDTEALKQLGIDKEKESLERDITSVITVTPGGKARNLEIADEIPDDEFYRVVEQLYNLTAAIDNKRKN